MSTFENDNSIFYSMRVNDKVVIKFRKSAFSLLADVTLGIEYIKLLKTINEDSEINGLVFINDIQIDEAEGMQALINFWKSNQHGGPSSFNTFQNILEQILLLLLNISKPQVAGLHGETTSEYLGYVLSCDARIATPDTCFNFRNAGWGLPPSPGLTYFLPRFIGQGKALDLIQNAKIISAKEALSFGLITEIVSYDQLQARCLEKIDTLSKQPAGVAVISRMLINPDKPKFEHCIERYIKALTKAKQLL